MRAAALLLLALCCFAASVSANDVFTTTGSFYNNSACTTNQMPYSLTYNSITDGTGNSTSACVKVGNLYYTSVCLPYQYGGLNIDGMYSIYEYSDATCKTPTLRSATNFKVLSFPSGCVSMAGFTADSQFYTVVGACTSINSAALARPSILLLVLTFLVMQMKKML